MACPYGTVSAKARKVVGFNVAGDRVHISVAIVTFASVPLRPAMPAKPLGAGLLTAVRSSTLLSTSQPEGAWRLPL